MSVDIVLIRSDVVNRSRISRGIGRMQFYLKVGCDPRTGVKLLNHGCVRLDVAVKVANVLGLPVARVIDIEQSVQQVQLSARTP